MAVRHCVWYRDLDILSKPVLGNLNSNLCCGKNQSEHVTEPHFSKLMGCAKINAQNTDFKGCFFSITNDRANYHLPRIILSKALVHDSGLEIWRRSNDIVFYNFEPQYCEDKHWREKRRGKRSRFTCSIDKMDDLKH